MATTFLLTMSTFDPAVPSYLVENVWALRRGRGDRIGPIVLSGLSEVDLFDANELVSDVADELKILKFPTELAGSQAVWLAISPEDRSRATD